MITKGGCQTVIQLFQAFFCIALVSAASAAPQLLAGHVGHVVAGGQRSHQSVSKPFQGEVRTTSQAKSFGSPIASVASSDSTEERVDQEWDDDQNKVCGMLGRRWCRPVDSPGVRPALPAHTATT